MRGIVVGAGGPTRELLRRLGDAWELTVVEPEGEVLEQARGVRPFRPIRGDGTSRLILERAGLAEADAVVAATNDDDANLEICRIALDAGVHRIVAVAADPERVADFRALGVSTFSPDSIAARRIEENLEPRRITSQSFAHGKAEAIEYELTARSPVCGRSLQDLHARSWVIGAILRDGQLLIPHGETVLESGDLVTVVGAGADFVEIVRAFTAGQPRFPLDYGKDIVLTVEPKELDAIGEAVFLVRNSRATGLLLIQRDEESVRDEDERARLQEMSKKAEEETAAVEVRRLEVNETHSRTLLRLITEESVGILVRSFSRRGWLGSLLAASRAASRSRQLSCPVLLARGSHPYKRILVPARRTPAGRAAARAAIDLAVRGKIALTALAAIDPIFLAGPLADLEAKAAMSWLREDAAVLGLSFEGLVRRGNAIRTFLGEIRESDLLVLGVSSSRRRFPFAVVDQLAGRAPVSVLLVPTMERD